MKKQNLIKSNQILQDQDHFKKKDIDHDDRGDMRQNRKIYLKILN